MKDEKINNKFGIIYKITNVLNGKIYIGQTCQRNPYKRIKSHFKLTGRGVDLVYRAANKYGKDNFIYEILCSCLDLETLNKMERYFINFFNSLVPNGYNIRDGGTSGGKLTQEIIEKIRLKNLGKPSKLKGISKTNEHKKAMSKVRKGFDSENRKLARKLFMHGHNNKPIEAINIKTSESFKFMNISECADKLHLDQSCISRTLRNINNRSQHKGWKFKTLDKALKTK